MLLATRLTFEPGLTKRALEQPLLGVLHFVVIQMVDIGEAHLAAGLTEKKRNAYFFYGCVKGICVVVIARHRYFCCDT